MNGSTPGSLSFTMPKQISSDGPRLPNSLGADTVVPMRQGNICSLALGKAPAAPMGLREYVSAILLAHV